MIKVKMGQVCVLIHVNTHYTQTACVQLLVGKLAVKSLTCYLKLMQILTWLPYFEQNYCGAQDSSIGFY